jgi:hypothetical protein
MGVSSFEPKILTVLLATLNMLKFCAMNQSLHIISVRVSVSVSHEFSPTVYKISSVSNS